MPKLTDSELCAMLSAQYAGAMAASNASKLSGERESALAYYNGDMPDMPAAAGRSSAVSMDVADTIEGIMPQLMEVFAGSDEVVKFEPVGPEDVQAAEQETDYINHVFMNQNAGFLTLYSFIKDALLSKVGVVKVWWEKTEREERETYFDKTDDEYALIITNPDVEVVEHSVHQAESQDQNSQPASPVMDGAQQPLGVAQTLHDVTVVVKKTTAQARVMGVPPEEFGIEAGARNIRDCNYCFHKIVDRTESDLIEMGYDAEQVGKLPSYRAWTNSEETARDTVDEQDANSDAINKASRQVEITEHYVRMDYRGDGKACLYRVTTGGKDGEVLRLDGKPDVIEFDAIPFAAMTPIIVTHRFYGRSLADLVMDIQKIKTALLRALLDNAYLANNRRTEVAESMASENTLDDLLVSRPGGIVRVKTMGALREIDFTPIGNHVYPLLEYQDMTKEVRSGVTKQGQGIDANALQNQSATAVNQAFSASQARVRLIARIFAETGVKDLFWLLHGTIKKHGDKQQVVRLKNQWMPVDPRNWKSRDDLTVTVGLGDGSKEAQIVRLQLLIGAQEKAIAAGLVSKRNLYQSARELVKLCGRKDPEAFFVDPSKPPDQNDPNSAPLPPPPDPKVTEIQMNAQLAEKSDQRKAQLDHQAQQNKAQIEGVQAQADIATQQQKTQAEMAMAERKAQLEERLMLLDHELKREQHAAELEMKRELHQHSMAQSQMNMAAGAQAHEAKMAQANRKPANG